MIRNWQNHFKNFTFRYIDDVLSLNKLSDYLHHIYPPGLEIKNTTDSDNSSYLILLIEFEKKGQLQY